ncbi:tRNA glutamyl-Q(34) synthetase GluQRS [Phyllobacterium brassicacearum]|uniref:tRNA glutamyl-Q(34) synthetase GluQRS n=1 Tax=Phyllobacterium brassicacearum TaxID=314235 RepID=A0A2P7BRW9_9HYPH|nr:tRNA glutamyl-Q(34) synthetase GluQRS [Phyllobacterium brassicacearum]PSH69194.1 tRNA glutamyl-Q(34) synthetase GluQRS [Phyllobacterium brassicacearum]TDQ22579.1 glutamyl-Q tRNA(Asp) synthetase [Phyllobacterium brassicacearum]
MTAPVFRFAPSPNGHLHLGHAYSALLNLRMARAMKGRLLLRMEDIDRERCTPELDQAMLEDLHWIGLDWELPVRRQSEHFAVYSEALDKLIGMDLVYPAFLSRGDIKREIEKSAGGKDNWPRDPDGTLLYPNADRQLSQRERDRRIGEGRLFSWRLNMDRAVELLRVPLSWTEFAPEHTVLARPQDWGDIIIARRDMPTSYHLSVVIDDALQGITHVVRGRDLLHATSVHRLLQHLLGIEPPLYHHHTLILDRDGQKLAKSRKDTSLRDLREQGKTRQDIFDQVGL